MTYYSKKEYKLLGYRKSKTKHKKYDAVLENKKTGKIKYVPFGDNRSKVEKEDGENDDLGLDRQSDDKDMLPNEPDLSGF